MAWSIASNRKKWSESLLLQIVVVGILQGPEPLVTATGCLTVSGVLLVSEEKYYASGQKIREVGSWGPEFVYTFSRIRNLCTRSHPLMTIRPPKIRWGNESVTGYLPVLVGWASARDMLDFCWKERVVACQFSKSIERLEGVAHLY